VTARGALVEPHMSATDSFHSIYTHGFVRVAVCTPTVEVAAPAVNAKRTLALAQQAVDKRAVMALFPELGLSAYSIEDLALQDALLDAVESAVGSIIEASRALPALFVIGAPVRSEQRLFNWRSSSPGALLGMSRRPIFPTIGSSTRSAVHLRLSGGSRVGADRRTSRAVRQ
jgi:predicted amidohydrolase